VGYQNFPQRNSFKLISRKRGSPSRNKIKVIPIKKNIEVREERRNIFLSIFSFKRSLPFKAIFFLLFVYLRQRNKSLFFNYLLSFFTPNKFYQIFSYSLRCSISIHIEWSRNRVFATDYSFLFRDNPIYG